MRAEKARATFEDVVLAARQEAAAEGPSRLVCIVGPTATGKTELAVRVCEAVGGEVVSADSVQVYRRFELGTGKPSAEERRRAPHHLVDVVDPLDAMDASRWVALADDAIRDVRARGKVPIVCGGTFLWVKALVSGLATMPAADPSVRDGHRALAEREGRAALHARLLAVDPASAARLHPNDLVRVSRALEVFELSGETMSALQARHAFGARRYDASLFAIDMPVEALRARIEARARAWLAAGWVEEVRALIADGLVGARAIGSVGFAEIAGALAVGARLDEPDELEALRAKIVQHTRIFARRQRTWLNHESVRWLAR
jgi:tRNA dimethylallyltransferase